MFEISIQYIEIIYMFTYTHIFQSFSDKEK